jgi:hypothetical protein
MTLIPCPECDRMISEAASACPQCGHPCDPLKDSVSPSCYSCDAVATTRCEKCNALSCARHLRSVYVQYGDRGGREMRCDKCYSSAVTGKVIGAIIFVVVLIIILLQWMSMSSRFSTMPNF